MWNEEELKQQLGESWYEQLKHEFKQPYMVRLREFLDKERVESKTVLPIDEHIFHFFQKCPFERTMAVLVGIDPALHQSSDIIGSFRQELIDDIYEGIAPKDGMSLDQIARQGVLILDTCLTYDLKLPFRHESRGWEQFVGYVIQRLNSSRTKISFVIFGEFAKQYDKFIDEGKHKVIHVPHPKHKEIFKGTKPFSKVNSFLKANYNTIIDF